MRYLSIIIMILFAACALSVGEERLIERKGDRDLREGLSAPMYVGVSQPMPTEAQAVENAMQDARRQIVESLGIEIIIETIETGSDTIRNGIVNRSLSTRDMTRLYARNILQVSAESRYIEKWERRSRDGITRYYKVWVAVPFREKEFRALWKETIRQFSRQFQTLEPISQWSNPEPSNIPELFLLYESVTRIEREFLSQYWMIHLPEYRRFQEEKTRLEGILRNLTGRMHIDFAERNGNVSGNLLYIVKIDDRPVPGMPVRIISDVLKIDRIVYSDVNGVIGIDYQFEGIEDAELLIVAGCTEDQSDVTQFLPSVQTNLPSPLNHHNITLSLDIQTHPQSSWLAAELERRLQDRGFKIMQSNPDYLIQAEFRATVDSTSTVFGFKAARSVLNLRLLDASKSHTLMTWRLPNEEYRDTRGFGKTSEEARQNALQLKNLLLREEAMREIVRRIESALDDRIIRSNE